VLQAHQDERAAPKRERLPRHCLERDDARRILVQVECVNTFGNVNAAVRSSDRKAAEAEAQPPR